MYGRQGTPYNFAVLWTVFEENWLGNLGQLGSNKEIQPEIVKFSILRRLKYLYLHCNNFPCHSRIEFWYWCCCSSRVCKAWDEGGDSWTQ